MGKEYEQNESRQRKRDATLVNLPEPPAKFPKPGSENIVYQTSPRQHPFQSQVPVPDNHRLPPNRQSLMEFSNTLPIVNPNQMPSNHIAQVTRQQDSLFQGQGQNPVISNFNAKWYPNNNESNNNSSALPPPRSLQQNQSDSSFPKIHPPN